MVPIDTKQIDFAPFNIIAREQSGGGGLVTTGTQHYEETPRDCFVG